MSDEISAEEFDAQLLEGLRSHGLDIKDGTVVHDAEGSILFKTAAGYFLAIHGKRGDQQTVVVLDARDLVPEMERFISVLSKQGDMQILSDIGVPVIGGPDDDEDETQQATLQ